MICRVCVCKNCGSVRRNKDYSDVGMRIHQSVVHGLKGIRRHWFVCEHSIQFLK